MPHGHHTDASMMLEYDFGVPLLRCEFLGSKDHLLLVGNTTCTPHSPTNKKSSRSLRSISPQSRKSGSISPSSPISVTPSRRSRNGKQAIRFDLTPPRECDCGTKSKGSPDYECEGCNLEDAEDNTKGVISVVDYEYLNGVDGKKVFVEKSRYDCTHWRKGIPSNDNNNDPYLSGSQKMSLTKDADGYGEYPFFVNDFATFGSTLHGRSYLASVGGNNRNEGVIKCLEIQRTRTTTLFQPTNEFLFMDKSANASDGVLTSVDHCSRNDILAIASESGQVFVYDTAEMKQIMCYTADDFGLDFIRFTPGGLLGTCGLDVEEPVKVFDLRDPSTGHRCARSIRQRPKIQHTASPPNKILSAQQRFDKVRLSSSRLSSLKSQQSHSSIISQSSNFTLKTPAFSCLNVHPCEERVLLGNTAGVIAYWDLKVDAMVEFPNHHSIGKNFCLLP